MNNKYEFDGFAYEFRGEYFRLRKNIQITSIDKLKESIQKYKIEYPKSTAKDFVNHLIESKMAIHLNDHPGLVFKILDW